VTDPGPWVFTIHGADTRAGWDGFDSMILAVPDHWYGEVGGQRAMIGPVVGRELRQLSEFAAGELGRKLHHAEWQFTSDPAKVEQLGMIHGCPVCRAQTDLALEWLRQNPGGEVAAGVLYWLAEPP
jgi:hypothetical protein